MNYYLDEIHMDQQVLSARLQEVHRFMCKCMNFFPVKDYTVVDQGLHRWNGKITCRHCTVAFCLSCMFLMVFPGLWKASAVFPTPFTLDGTLKRGKKKRKSKKSIGLVIRRQPPSRCSCCRSGLVPTSRNVLLGLSSLDTSLHLQQDPDSGLSLMASWCSFSYLSLPPIHPSFHSLTNHSPVPSPLPGALSTSGRSFIPPRP